MTSRRIAPGQPYARYAFLNPYNLSLFGGLVVFGVLSEHTWVSVLACAAEAMWLIFAPDSKLLRRLWFDPAFARAEQAFAADRRKEKAAGLAPIDGKRLVRLCEQKALIEKLAHDNPSLTVELLSDELARLDGLVDEFLDLAARAVRAERHTTTFDFAEMSRQWRTHQDEAKRLAAGDPRRALAEKNMAVLGQRRSRYDDLTRTIQLLRGQMELIEQTFCLLGDEIMSMASPSELGGRIDELRIAVDAVRETTETIDESSFLGAMEEEDHEQRHR